MSRGLLHGNKTATGTDRSIEVWDLGREGSLTPSHGSSLHHEIKPGDDGDHPLNPQLCARPKLVALGLPISRHGLTRVHLLNVHNVIFTQMIHKHKHKYILTS
eukprot:892165-Amphidinium_carterae.1